MLSRRARPASRSVLLAVVLTVLALVGCSVSPAADGTRDASPAGTSGVGGTTVVPAGTVPPSLPPAPTSAPPPPDLGSPGGCGVPVDGYLEVAPFRRALVRGVPGAVPTAAVVVLHGFTGTPEHIEANSGWTPFLAARGVVAVYPEGTRVTQGGFGWNTGTRRFSTTKVDDIEYLVAVLRTLVQRACVDPHRIMITGESNGGAMTLLAACDGRTRPLFVFFAPVIPAIDAGALDRCAAGPALSFIALAGKADRTVPYDGVYPAGLVPMLAQEAWFTQVVAARNGCEVRTLTRTVVDDAEVVTPGVCADPPTLVAIDDGTHTWPGGTRMPGGPVPGRFPANEYLWAHSHLATP